MTEMFGLKCRPLSDVEIEGGRRAEAMCYDEHCWSTPTFLLTLLAGSEEDGLHLDMPICERHAAVLGDAIHEMGRALDQDS